MKSHNIAQAAAPAAASAPRLSAMAPVVTKELRQYASFLRSSGRLGTAHGVDFLIAQLEGQV